MISKKEIVEKILQDNPRWECLASLWRGNIFWCVWKFRNENKGIYCYHRINNSYKAIPENQSPPFYTCPLKYIDELAPLNQTNYPNSQIVKDWRNKVRQEQENKKKLYKQLAEAWRSGKSIKIKLVEGYGPLGWFDIESFFPLWGRNKGKLYKIPRTKIGEIKVESEE